MERCKVKYNFIQRCVLSLDLNVVVDMHDRMEEGSGSR